MASLSMRMRRLHFENSGNFSLTEDCIEHVSLYAILSYTREKIQKKSLSTISEQALTQIRLDIKRFSFAASRLEEMGYSTG